MKSWLIVNSLVKNCNLVPVKRTVTLWGGEGHRDKSGDALATCHRLRGLSIYRVAQNGAIFWCHPVYGLKVYVIVFEEDDPTRPTPACGHGRSRNLNSHT